MKKNIWLLAIALFLGFLSSAFAASGTWLAYSFEYKDVTYPYAVYLPPGYNAQESWPIILFLHGKAESGNDGVKQTKVGLGEALDNFPDRYPAVVVLPQATRRHKWNKNARDAALLILDKATVEFNGDPKRSYLTGLSLGGFASWNIAAEYPDRFAAVVPISSTLRPSKLAPRLINTPIWAFNGALDILVPPFLARFVVEALVKAGATNIHWTLYPHTFHNSWDQAYANPELATWLFAQRLALHVN